jgi:hypothetical protein
MIKKVRPDYSKYRELLTKMEVGHSFFEPDVKSEDLYFLRQIAYRAGIKISIHNVTDDDIYHQAGVRVWREPDDKKLKDAEL